MRMRVGSWIAIMSLALLMGGNVRVEAADARVGKEAPGFTLVDAKEQERSLAEFRGKYVVLEWFNHNCPFVKKHYGSGNMQRLQRTYTEQGVVWLSINSSAPREDGYLTPEEAGRLMREQRAASTAILVDPDGTVGRRYGAKTTPHMFIIDPDGDLIYQGAIDDRPSTDLDDIAGAKNYVAAVFQEAFAERRISVPSTKPYGCSVKY